MPYRVLADVLLVVHLAWILFMLWGVVVTVWAFWKPALFDRWLFRSLHLGGMLFVGTLELLGKFCPLTLWEYDFRRLHDPGAENPGSFIINLIERLIYPDVDPIIVTVPTIAIALFTLVVFVMRPPSKCRLRRRQQAYSGR